MSYLVDALKKAERERYARQAQDIHAMSADAGPSVAGQRAGPWLWLVAILVATNVALAIYVWRPRPADSAPAVAAADTPALDKAQSLTRFAPDFSLPAGKPQSSPARLAQSVPQPAAQSPRAAPDQDSTITASSGATAPADDQNPAGARPTRSSQRHGQVTYSKAPLTGAGAADTGTTSRTSYRGDSNTPDQSEVNGVPSVEINGQLYSTVPGRSFILVNGRRYHEGERLAAGPAVESIGPNGAMLRYHGQRYHVAGPG
ncbi:MAG: general secretion pathway protein GspB [Salinisphaera sp.]|uniref:general secretion pathway protein GspB n=1 Tax=Salinisphaera sp. TaxID=1914330 RepID=UPI003C7C2D4C